MEASSSGQPIKVGIPQVFPADSTRVSFVEMRKSTARQPQQRQDPAPLLSVNGDLRSPTSSGVSLSTASNDENGSSHQNSIVFDQVQRFLKF